MQKADALEHPFAVVFQGYAPKRMVRFPAHTGHWPCGGYLLCRTAIASALVGVAWPLNFKAA